MLILVAGTSLVRPMLMGDVVPKRRREDSGALLMDGVGSRSSSSSPSSSLRPDVHDADRRRAAGDGRLRATVFAFLQKLELRSYDRTPVGRLVTRATNDVDAGGELFASGVLNAIGDLVALVGHSRHDARPRLEALAHRVRRDARRRPDRQLRSPRSREAYRDIAPRRRG